MIKRILMLTVTFLFFSVSIAYAGYGVHNTLENSDTCPVCHEHKPIGDAFQSHESIEYDFCTTCHGVSAAGADNDVVSGMYDNPENLNGSFGAPLNSGGFERIGGPTGKPTTSTHSVDGTVYPIFGNSASSTIALSCTSCHDPDGSANYRILRDVVNGKDVTGFVKSNEVGFDDSLSEDPEVYKNYVPNYTTPNYKSPDDPDKGIVGWCAACHDNYKSNLYETDPKTGRKHFYYTDSDGKRRYRHAVNVKIGQNPTGNTDTVLPLAKTSASVANTDANNLVICLTCHRVHGTDATMTERAQVEPTKSAASSGPGRSALLRLDNRGVCQNCHRK